MNKKFLTFVAVALMLAACSSEEPMTPPTVENDAMGANPYRVSLTDALKNADALLGELGEGETTRSAERKVESVEYYSRPGTRALGGDTLLYLVNYADDAGFALLSADSRLRPIYAISDEGSMSFSDTTYNKGLALFASGVEAELASLPSIQLPIDSLPEGPIIKPEGTVRLTSQKSPMLGYYQSRWGQNSPFNKYCFTKDSTQATVGCGAIVVGQVLSYYKYPSMVDSLNINWNKINEGADNDSLAKLLRTLGNESYLKMEYSTNEDGGSGCDLSKINQALSSLGYSVYCDFIDFDESNIENFTKNNTPSIIKGERYISENLKTAHVWIIDGYKQYTYRNLGTGYETKENVLFHCVWGWSGTNNGYFYWSKTNSLGGSPIETGPNDGNSTIDWVYDLSIKYMSGFNHN